MKKILIALAMILLLIFSVCATEYYVSTSGDDDNPGTQDLPWRTLSKVNSEFSAGTFNPGDNILFKRGDVWTDGTFLRIRSGGAAGQPLTIGAYGSGDKPVFDGGTHVQCLEEDTGYITLQDIRVENPGTGSAIGFYGGNMHNITISRVDIIDTAQNAIFLAAIDGYLIEDCYVNYAANSGIVIYGSEKNPPITNGVIRNCVVEGAGANDCFTLHRSDGTPSYGIGPNHLLENNVGHNCREQAFDFTSGQNIVLIDSEGYDNGDSSILIGGTDNVTVDRFYSHDERRMGILIGGANNTKITNSIIYSAGYHQLTIGGSTGARNTEIYNNVIVHGVNSTGSIIDISKSATNDVVFRNNIITSLQQSSPSRYVRYLDASPDSTNSVFSNNIWWRPDSAATGDNRMWYDGTDVHRFDWWQARYPTDMLVNPELVDAINGDLHLKDTSPAIDAGFDVGLTHDFEKNTRPQGSGIDIGAYEFDSGTPPPETLEGDLNNDGKVNFQDLIIVASNFGTSNSVADTDNNGIVDIFDIVFVASRFT